LIALFFMLRAMILLRSSGKNSHMHVLERNRTLNR
jgi:hypothetical protein